MKDLAIGMIGLDTSHAAAFTKLLNDPDVPYHVKGARVVKAFPAGSMDFELSYSRLGKITDEVRTFGVEIVSSIEEAAEQVDGILLESVDGRIHLEQFRQIAPYRKPVFIDKPFTVSVKDAQQIIKIAREYGTPVMSCSALRFAESLNEALASRDKEKVVGADCYGPIEMVDTQPGYFWYGIHTIEMLYTIFGSGAKVVQTLSQGNHELLIGEWIDGRIGVIRANPPGNYQFNCVIHFEDGIELVAIASSKKPYYASLLEQIIGFFASGKSPVDITETLEIINFIEAANKSLKNGGKVALE